MMASASIGILSQQDFDCGPVEISQTTEITRFMPSHFQAQAEADRDIVACENFIAASRIRESDFLIATKLSR